MTQIQRISELVYISNSMLKSADVHALEQYAPQGLYALDLQKIVVVRFLHVP